MATNDGSCCCDSDQMRAPGAELQRLLERARIALNKADGRHEVDRVIGAMLTFTKCHFCREEILMDRFSFPDQYSHRMEHNRFTARLIRLGELNQLQQVDVNVLVANITRILSVWIDIHVREDDRKLSGFLGLKE